MEVVVRNLKDSSKFERKFSYDEIKELTSIQTRRNAREIIFITSNKFKVAELRQMINKNLATVNFRKVEVPEIQDSDALNIVQAKCRAAFEDINRNNAPKQEQKCPAEHPLILIEDVSLCLRALNGMPGPYIKWFWESIGCEGLHKILSAYDDKGADAICTYALMENKESIIFCRGSISGEIISPIGESWGWDPCFKENKSGKTFGQMNEETKSRYSHRAKAVEMLNKLLEIEDFGVLFEHEH